MYSHFTQWQPSDPFSETAAIWILIQHLPAKLRFVLGPHLHPWQRSFANMCHVWWKTHTKKTCFHLPTYIPTVQVCLVNCFLQRLTCTRTFSPISFESNLWEGESWVTAVGWLLHRGELTPGSFLLGSETHICVTITRGPLKESSYETTALHLLHRFPLTRSQN